MADRAPAVHVSGFQQAGNVIVRGLLRTPLLSRVVGNGLLTLYVVGRKSGRRYQIPVAYARQDADLLIGTPFGWGRNLRTGEPVQIRLKGRLREAGVVAYQDEEAVTGALAVMCRQRRTFANFNKIGFDADGNPKPEDLHRAWTDGTLAFRLTPR